MTEQTDLERQLTLALFAGAEITTYQEGPKLVCEIRTPEGDLVVTETGVGNPLAVMRQALRKWEVKA